MSARAPGERVRVLIAGSIHEKPELVRSFLEDDGYSVVGEVLDPVVLAPALAVADPDAVVVEDALLGEDEAEGIAQIRTAAPDASVIVVTSAEQPAAAPIGADGYLVKGMGLATLTALLHSLVVDEAATVGAAVATAARRRPASEQRFVLQVSAVAAGVALVVFSAFAIFGGTGLRPEAIGPRLPSPSVVEPRPETPVDVARQHLDELTQALQSGDYVVAAVLAQALMNDRDAAISAGYSIRELDAAVLASLGPLIPTIAPRAFPSLQQILGDLLPPPSEDTGTAGGDSGSSGGTTTGGGTSGGTVTGGTSVQGPVDTTTAITAVASEPSVVGETYTVSWSVSATVAGTPTGTVAIDDGEGGSCSATVERGSCSLASTSAGSKTITATYSGDQDFNASSAAASHEVDEADTTTEIASVAPDATVTGESYTVSWSVTVDDPGSGTPTGTVGVDDGEGNSCSAPVEDGGCSLDGGSAGETTITATYSGDQDFNGSHETTAHPVEKADTTTTITSHVPDPSIIGGSSTVSWTVTVDAPGSGTPTGTVTVNDGDGASCSAPVEGGGCSLVWTSGGPKTLTATYSGDQDFNGSSDTESHTVDRFDTTTTITSDTPDPSVTGEPYTVSWTVGTSGPGMPTGTVTVDDGVGGSCSAPVGSGGCSLAGASTGDKTLTATYSGDQDFKGSSDTESHKVDEADTTTAISSVDPDPSVTGESYTVSWSVTVDAPGSGTPTGAVTVDDGEGNSCSASVEDGGCSLDGVSAGDKTLTATYSGDQDFKGSVGTGHHRVTDEGDGGGGDNVHEGTTSAAATTTPLPASEQRAGTLETLGADALTDNRQSR